MRTLFAATLTLLVALAGAQGVRPMNSSPSYVRANYAQAHMVEACNAEADRLDDVLEFFSLDAGSSKHAPGA